MHAERSQGWLGGGLGRCSGFEGSGDWEMGMRGIENLDWDAA